MSDKMPSGEINEVPHAAPETAMDEQQVVIDQLRRNVAGRLEEIFGSVESDQPDWNGMTRSLYANNIADTIMRSASGGDYFRNLIPKSGDMPSKEYDDSFLRDEIIHVESLKRDIRAKLSEGNVSKTDDSFCSGVIETVFDGGKHQQMLNFFVRKDARMIIEEIVENTLNDEINLPQSFLSVDFSPNHRVILNSFLPVGYHFHPGEMISIHEEADPENMKIISKIRPVDLKQYPGAQKTEGRFVMIGGYWKRVGYGNLNKAGGILSLFHEIAHAWQNAYHDRKPRADFRELYDKVGVYGNILETKIEEAQSGRITSADLQFFRNEITERLSKLGVELDANKFVYSGQEIESDQVIVNYLERSFVVRSARFAELQRAYAKEERDAWAHAIKVLRIYRQNGLDFEPQLKTNDDIEEIVHGALATYQQSIEEDVQHNELAPKFTRKK